MKSDNIQKPFFGPEWPVYPAVDQLIHISGSGDSKNVCPGFVVQQTSPTTPTFRDREACYVFEANGAKLGQGYLVCRLVGVYGGDANGIGSLPLYAGTCCPGSTAGSSSSSGH